MEDAIDNEIDDLEDILSDANAEPMKLSYATLERITGNFSEDNVIGRGGFGVVYLVRILFFFKKHM